ncbi:hypothetical protein ACP70R_025803 [Stipagrostis hirtigluma subsp. patula]
MADAAAAAAKLRRLENHRGLGDALKPSSFNMEDLPLSEIQSLVMSLLSLKEAARTSIVARNWRMLWTYHPNLCFYGSKDWPTEENYIKIRRAKFIETINHIVQQHSGIVLNKFSIRASLRKKHSDHLDKWISFATASRASTIDIDLWPKRRAGPLTEVYNFPLELLGVQDGSFIQSLFLKDVSIKPHSDICGVTKLRRLLLHYVEIIGDLPGLLNNCCALEDLELVSCCGVDDLNVPHQLNELRHLLISQMFVETIHFHVAGLVYFEYEGKVVSISLHGCSKLEKATITFIGVFDGENIAVSHALTSIPTISTVKVLNLNVAMRPHPVWASQVHTLTTKPACMFTLLRHLTCEIKITTDDPNSDDVGLIRFAHFLNLAPQLETLQLHEVSSFIISRSSRRFT